MDAQHLPVAGKDRARAEALIEKYDVLRVSKYCIVVRLRTVGHSQSYFIDHNDTATTVYTRAAQLRRHLCQHERRVPSAAAFYEILNEARRTDALTTKPKYPLDK